MTDKDGHELSYQDFCGKIKRRLQAYWLELVTGWLWWGVGNLPWHSVRRLFYRLSGLKIGRHSTIHMKARILSLALALMVN